MELSVAQKHTVARAEQSPSALSGMFELKEVRDMRNFMFCLLEFTFRHPSTVQSDSSPAHRAHTEHALFGTFLLSKPEFTEEHILFMFYAIYVTMLYTELFRFLHRHVKNPCSAICAGSCILK